MGECKAKFLADHEIVGGGKPIAFSVDLALVHYRYFLCVSTGTQIGNNLNMQWCDKCLS